MARKSVSTLAGTGLVLLVAGSTVFGAREFTRTGAAGASWYAWGGAPTWGAAVWPFYPGQAGAGDVACITNAVHTAYEINVDLQAANFGFGMLVHSNAGSAKVYIRPAYGQTNNLALNNNSSPVVIQNLRGTLVFSPQWNSPGLLRLPLSSPALVVTNGGTFSTSVNVFTDNPTYDLVRISGGTAAAPKKITVVAGGSGALTFRPCGYNTDYVGTWTVEGDKSTLEIRDDRNLGTNTANSVTLSNGGILYANVTGGWSLRNRTLLGTGLLNSTNKTLTVGSGGALSPGTSSTVGTLNVVASNMTFAAGATLVANVETSGPTDLVDVTLSPNTTLTLGGTVDVRREGIDDPVARTTWKVLQVRNGTIEGEFDQTLLPSELYSLSVSTTSVTVTYNPPPAGTILKVH